MSDEVPGSPSLAALWQALQDNDAPYYLERTRHSIKELVPQSSAVYAKGAEALVHLHRYQTTGRNVDVFSACRLLSHSISLNENPEYAFFFHLAATQSIEEFERSVDLDYLDRSMDLLEPFLASGRIGPHTRIMGGVRLACLCLQYSLVLENQEPFQSALDTLANAKTSSVLVEWSSSSFGKTRSLVFIAHAVSQIYHQSFPPKGLAKEIANIKRVLEALPPIINRQCTSFQILMLSMLLLAIELKDEETRQQCIHSILWILNPDFRDIPAPGISSLSSLLEQAQLECCNRVFCLLHQADALDHQDVDTTNQPIGSNVTDDTSGSWYEDWEDTRSHLRRRLEADGPQSKSASSDAPSRLFEFSAEVDRKPRPRLLTYRVQDPPGIHVCVFRFVVTEVQAPSTNKTDLEPESGHHAFLSLFQKLAQRLSRSQIEELLHKPEEIPFSPYLSDLCFTGTEDDWIGQPLAWRRSRGIVALLSLNPIRFRSSASVKDFILASRDMVRVQLVKEPAFTAPLYSIAASLRPYEDNSKAMASASELLKEFLSVQSRGTKRQWVGVLDFAMSSVMEYLCARGDGERRKQRHPELFAFAMELFREAMEIDDSLEDWMYELKRVIVIGRVLHYRLKNFWSSETEEVLCETTRLMTVLWDLFPIGRPFRASLLETVVTSTLLFLAQRMATQRWHNSIRLLTLALELRLNGESSVPSPNDKLLKHPEMAAEDLIASGINVCVYNFESEAICLLHISDVVRSLASDCSRHPGYLAISLDMYLRSLQLQWHPFDEGKVNGYYALMDEWSIERTRLREGINLVVQNLAAGLPSFLEQPPLTIYHYRATTAKPIKSGGHSHTCVLSYYPTKVLKIEPEEQGNDKGSSSVVIEDSAPNALALPPEEPYYTTWPDNLVYPFNNPDEQGTRLTSTIFPFIHQLSQPGASQQLFAMPLSDRTMHTYIRSLQAQTRLLDGDVSMLTESIIRQNATTIYWDPRDVLLEHRLEKLKENTPYLARLGPLQTLIARGPERCLELLEVARSLFWSKLLRLRMPFEDFPLPDRLKEELKLVTEELEQCKAQSEQTASKEEAKKQYDLEWRFEYLLGEAREVPGFERLLMPKSHEQLLEAAEAGPVVMLIGNDSMYAALIIRRNGVDSILLDQLTETALDGMITGLNKATNAARGAMVHGKLEGIPSENQDEDPEEGRGVKKKVVARQPQYLDFLEQMWHAIVEPIVAVLKRDSIVSETRRPRLWWCPTGKLAFLPVHAAGVKFGLPTMASTSKYVISSYIPTLSALMDARSHHKTAQSSPHSVELRTLVLAQPTTKDHDDLPMTLKELELIESIIPSQHLIRMSGTEASLSNTNVNRKVSEAIHCLMETTILHLACHGHQDRADPLSSGFQLEDGRLTVSHLIGSSTPKAYVAFLSACESASNDFSVPDESLNLAAAMLYAGFRSVIGTMWSMNDNDGPEVARFVYQAIFEQTRSGCQLEADTIPRALDSAIHSLQAKGVHPSRWATYIHVGI